MVINSVYTPLYTDSDLQNQQNANAHSGLYSNHAKGDKCSYYGDHNNHLKYDTLKFEFLENLRFNNIILRFVS